MTTTRAGRAGVKVSVDRDRRGWRKDRLVAADVIDLMSVTLARSD
jgi:hypothetical protein